jgi:hypothetical protein
MPTGKTLIDQFVEEQRIGRLGVTTSAGDSSSIIDLTRFGGPFAANEWTRGDPVRVTSGARAGEPAFFDELDPATGDMTVSPVLTGAPGSGASFLIVRRKYADSIDRLYEALSRGLNRYARRRMKVGLTYLPDGDLLGAAVGTFWQEGAGLDASYPVYLDLAHPNGFYTRVLDILTDATNGYAQNITPVPCHPGDVWDFSTWLRAGAASSTAELQIRDLIAGTAITPTLRAGALTTTSRSLVELAGEFVVPAACTLWGIRLVGQESAARVQMGPFLAAPRGARTYTSQAYFAYPIDAGEFYTRGRLTGTDAGPEQASYDKLELACDIDQLGWGLAFNFGEAPAFPLYFEALLGYADLTSETDSTHCPEDLALLAMECEFYESLAKATRDDKGRSPFDGAAADAIAKWQAYKDRRGNAPAKLTVRREYSGPVQL